MVDEDDKKEEQKFEFDAAGEVISYISREQAVVLAMQTADIEPGNYGPRYRGVRMVFEAVQQEEGEDFYTITLSVRPEGAFAGAVGQEQFFIAKEGTVARRQVLSLPDVERRRRFPMVPVLIAVVLVAIAGGVGAVLASGALGGGGDDTTAIPVAAVVPSATPTPTVAPMVVTEVTATPAPTAAPRSTATPRPTVPPGLPAVVAAAMAEDPSQMTAPAGLVHWWPGDGNADDIVGGNHGTLSSGAAFAQGMVGQAFSFDGVDDRVAGSRPVKWCKSA